MRGHRIILAGLVLLINSVGAFGQIAPASDQAPAAPAGPYDHLVPVLGSQLWPAYLNWGDLPFKLSFNQSLGYNDNVLGLAQGQPLPLGTPARGDLFSTTTFGAATKFTLGNQQFFVEGNYGLTRYRLDFVRQHLKLLFGRWRKLECLVTLLRSSDRSGKSIPKPY